MFVEIGSILQLRDFCEAYVSCFWENRATSQASTSRKRKTLTSCCCTSFHGGTCSCLKPRKMAYKKRDQNKTRPDVYRKLSINSRGVFFRSYRIKRRQ